MYHKQQENIYMHIHAIQVHYGINITYLVCTLPLKLNIPQYILLPLLNQKLTQTQITILKYTIESYIELIHSNQT